MMIRMTLLRGSLGILTGIGVIKEMAHLVIVRGLPGSGKSTFAKTLGFNHYEADQYFETENGYIFDPKQLRDAHEACLGGVILSLSRNQDAVVSNTFTQYWEMLPYIVHAIRNGHKVTVLTCEGNYGSIHGVPKDAIQRMKDRWEEYPI